MLSVSLIAALVPSRWRLWVGWWEVLMVPICGALNHFTNTSPIIIKSGRSEPEQFHQLEYQGAMLPSFNLSRGVQGAFGPPLWAFGPLPKSLKNWLTLAILCKAHFWNISDVCSLRYGCKHASSLHVSGCHEHVHSQRSAKIGIGPSWETSVVFFTPKFCTV